MDASSPFLPIDVLHDGARVPCLVHLPPSSSGPGPWPTVLFVHGSGEAGTDGVRQAEVGLGPRLRVAPERYPFLAVLPQLPVPDPSRTGALVAALDAAAAVFPIDPDRVVATGISMGGTATWNLGVRHGERFAGLVPICGRARVSDALSVAALPVWAFHGALDPIVPVAFSRMMVRAVRAAGGDARYTDFAGGRHDVWDAVYNDPTLLAWILERRRPRRSARGEPR